MEKAKRRELRGWSFGFYDDKPHFEEAGDGLKRRYLEEIELREVSIIDNTRTPAYIGTSIEMRGEREAAAEQRGLEDTVDYFEAVPSPEDGTKGKNADITACKMQAEILRIKGKRYEK